MNYGSIFIAVVYNRNWWSLFEAKRGETQIDFQKINNFIEKYVVHNGNNDT